MMKVVNSPDMSSLNEILKKNSEKQRKNKGSQQKKNTKNKRNILCL